MSLRDKLLAILLLFIGLIALNVIGSAIGWQFDASQSQAYTLTEESRKLLSRLEEPVRIQFFFSRSSESLPITEKNYAERIEELLDRYVAESDHMVSVEVIDPKPDTEEEQQALQQGIVRRPTRQGEPYYCGISVIQAEREVYIPAIQAAREPFLEYDLSQLIYEVQQEKQRRVGLMTSLPLTGSRVSDDKPWAVLSELSRFYQLENVGKGPIDPEIDLLLILHPRAVDTDTQFEIDQFLLRGKPVIIAVDPFSYYMSLEGNRSSGLEPYSSNLRQLFEGLGIRYNPAVCVGDLDLAAEVNVPGQPQADTFAAWVDAREFNTEVPATNQLKQVVLPGVGSFQLGLPETVTITPLIKSSKRSSSIMTTLLEMSSAEDIRKQVKPGNRELILAAALSGHFQSAFPEGRPIKSEDETQAWIEELNRESEENLKESQAPGTLVLLGDTDFLSDLFAVQVFEEQGKKNYIPLNHNLPFLFNLMEWVTGSQELIGLRSKGNTLRPFTVIEEMQKKAQREFLETDQQLAAKIREVESEIARYKQDLDFEQMVENPEIQAAVKEAQIELVELNRQRRLISKTHRDEISAIERNLILGNLLIMPLLIGAFALQYFYRRNTQQKSLRE